MKTLLYYSVALAMTATQALANDVETSFGSLVVGDKQVNTFIYSYNSKYYIPFPVYQSLNLAAQANQENVPQCGSCVALQEFAEVFKDGITYSLMPYSDYQDAPNTASVYRLPDTMKGDVKTDWAFWTNYRLELSDRYLADFDTNISSPFGTLNIRSNKRKHGRHELRNAQFIKEMPARELEMVVGDINTSNLAWGNDAALVGFGLFNTDPHLRTRRNMMKDLAIELESSSTLEVYSNGVKLFEGYQGAGTFSIEDIYGAGLVDIEVRKESEASSYYKFYFDNKQLPKGEHRVDYAVGQFNQGRFRYDLGFAINSEYGVTNDTWLKSSFVGTSKGYIGGLSTGYVSEFGTVELGYSQSDIGHSSSVSYRFRQRDFNLTASHSDDKNLLSENIDRSLTTVNAGYRLGNAYLSGSYIKSNSSESLRASFSRSFKNVSLSSSLSKNKEETSFSLNLSYRFDGAYTNYSYSADTHRVGIRTTQRVDDSHITYSLDHIKDEATIAQTSVDTKYGRFTGLLDSGMGRDRITASGSIVVHDHSVMATERLGDSIGIVNVQGGGVRLSGLGMNQDIHDGEFAAARLGSYRDNTFSVTPLKMGQALDTERPVISSGRKGAYVQNIKFLSPGVQVKFDGIKGDTLTIAGKAFKYFSGVGFFLKDIPSGEYTGAIQRNGKKVCQGTISFGSEFSITTLECSAIKEAA